MHLVNTKEIIKTWHAEEEKEPQNTKHDEQKCEMHKKCRKRKLVLTSRPSAIDDTSGLFEGI